MLLTQPLVDVATARQMLGNIGKTLLFSLLRDGQLTRVKLGRKTLVTTESIARFVDALPRDGSNESAVAQRISEVRA